MRKLKLTTLITIIISIILIILFSIFLALFLNYNKENRENYLHEKIKIVHKGQTLGEYTFAELEELSASKKFDAIYKPSGKPPKQRKYNGIELKELFVALNIDLDGAQSVLFIASDGLQKVYTVADIQADKNVFIANKVENKPFNKGILADAYFKPQEDGGPFVVIKAKDEFSQNRVKLLVSIEVK